jgi:hypothetical protein
MGRLSFAFCPWATKSVSRRKKYATLPLQVALFEESAMDWSAKDIQEFFWSLGPAAVGLFLIWFAQSKVAPNRAIDDQRMRLAVLGAYSGCWVAGIAALFAFVWIWVGPYVFHGRYIRGSLVDVPNKMSVSTVDTETADVFFISERTSDRAPVRTFAFVIRDSEGKVGRSTLRLSFLSKADEYYTGVELQKIGNAALLSDFNLAFQESKLPNGETRYSLFHSGSKTEFPLKHRDQGASNAPVKAQFASGGLSNKWLGDLLAAHAQSAPSLVWTRESIVSGLESSSFKVRNVAIAEIAEKLFSSTEYSNIANAIVTGKEEGTTLRGRWSVYDAIRVAIDRARMAAPVRNGILDPPLPASLPLSNAAFPRLFVDALADTASANDAAKWLFRHSGDRRTVEILFDEIGAQKEAGTKACYAAFAANIFYNWAVDVFLAAKKEGRQWFVSDGDVKLIENLYARISPLTGIAAANEDAASQFLIAKYGLGLFYAELSLLPDERLKGPLVQSQAERERWATQAKTLMTDFVAHLPSGSKLLALYRFPFHREIAAAVANSGVSTTALNPEAPRIVNPQIRDNFCKVNPRV